MKKMSLEILKKYQIKAKKSLGQNFLVNDWIVESIAGSIDIKWKNIVEVWPGYWALTEKLLNKKPNSLDLVELDRNMIAILEQRIQEKDLDISWIDFHIHNSDVLKFESQHKEYSIIANIPYYITSPILRHFLYDVEKKPKKMVILMQSDVWEKILWKWKNKSSVLSLFVNKKSKVSEIMSVGKENFIPSPKVESSVLLFELYTWDDNLDDGLFLETIKKWFREPRKKLLNNLVKSWYDKSYILQVFHDLWIEENTRWEDLDIAIWRELVLKINN